MAATHHGYNVLKMPGSGGIITVPCKERDAVCSLERAFQAASIKDPGNNAARYPHEIIPKNKKQQLHVGPQEGSASSGTSSGSRPAPGVPPSVSKEGAPGALLG